MENSKGLELEFCDCEKTFVISDRASRMACRRARVEVWLQ